MCSTQLKALLLAALIASGFFGWRYVEAVHDDVIEMSRNFYGTLRVKTTGLDGAPSTVWRMLHGVITHGEQYRAQEHKRTPTSYYGASSGVAQAIFTLREMNPGKPQRVGLIGMGVGTLAAYGREGDLYRFYELNPEVLELAQRRFSYLTDTKASLETPLGDARLVLERESAQQFDVLAVDAFSSDSIPVHLITREAVQVYKRHLAAGGVIAFHISNRYLNLQPVVQQIAADNGLKAWLIVDDPESTSPLYKSDWVLVTANEALLFLLKDREKGIPLQVDSKIRPWTDDYNNLFDVLK
jgi:SAM-dependent methyltransferase